MKKFLMITGCILLLVSSFEAAGQRGGSDDKDSLLESLKREYLYDKPQKVIDIAGEVMHSSHQNRVRFKAAILISTAYSAERDYMNALEKALDAREIAEKMGGRSFRAQIYNKQREI